MVGAGTGAGVTPGASLPDEVLRYRLLRLKSAQHGRTELLRGDYAEFVRQVFRTLNPDTKYIHHFGIDAIAAYLAAIERGEFRRLIINIPPRQMKTISTTVAWTAWLIGKNPHRKFMLATYSASLAQRNMLDLKKILESRWYKACFPDFVISEAQDTKKKILTSIGGHVISGSAGSKDFTGEGADYIIIDDPTDPEMALSDSDRERVNRWCTSTLMSRLNDKKKGVVLVVMQRLHEEDLSGHLLAKNNWAKHLCLPAKAEEAIRIEMGSFFKLFKKNELLDPSRLSQEVIDDLKASMSAYAYSGQYQQNPAPEDGGILPKRHWRRWGKGEPPDCFMVFQTLDTAFGEKEEDDDSAILTWGLFKGAGKDGEERACAILLDAEYGSWAFPELKKRARASYLYHHPDRVIVEDKASGRSLLQELRTLRYPVRPFKVTRDKVTRAHEASNVLEKGHVYYMPEDWADAVIKQCAMFPRGANDDLVDCVTSALIYVRKRYWLNLEEDESLVDKFTKADYKKKTKRKFYGGAGKRMEG